MLTGRRTRFRVGCSLQGDRHDKSPARSASQFDRAVRRTEEGLKEHTEKGETVLPWTIAVTSVAGAVVLEQPARRQFPQVAAKCPHRRAPRYGVVAASGATSTVVSVAHSGAKATWHNLPAEVDHG